MMLHQLEAYVAKNDMTTANDELRGTV